MTSKEWKKCKIGDVVDIRRGSSPRPIHKYLSNSGIPWVKIADATSNNSRFIYNTNEFITEEGIPYSVRVLPEMLIISNSATPGLPKIMKINACIHDGWLVFSNYKNILRDFLYYKFKDIRTVLTNQANGSVFQNLKTDIVKDFEILLPPLETQEKIVRLLSSLDDKIELNNKINQNLEQQAQAIFDKYIKIPCNYLKTGTIRDYCNVKSGFAFKSSWWKDSGVKVIKIKTIDNESINFTECSFVDKEKISIAEDFIVQGGDLLIAMTGATIGKFAIVPKIDEVLLVNQRVGKFFLGTHPIKKLPFLYCTLKQQDIINDIINKGQGSAQPNISSTDILNTSCYILENAELEKFNLICEPIFEKIITNKCENEKLTQLRDTLLPKLMSGEIDVDKVEV